MAIDIEKDLKVKGVGGDDQKSASKKYRHLTYGNMPLARVIGCEILFTLISGLGGALGLFLRIKLYPFMFKRIGSKVVFGRNVTIRHPHKIEIGDNVIFDDNCVLDAKGTDNRGIRIGNNVYIGRNTILYTKNGNLAIGDAVNISSNCQFVSSNDMAIGAYTVIGAYSYLLSGGGYDYAPGALRFSEQNGFLTGGPLTIGDNCWIGAGVTILDASCVGEHSVIAAGAVVTKPVPPNSIAGGVPARVIRVLDGPAT